MPGIEVLEKFGVPSLACHTAKGMQFEQPYNGSRLRSRRRKVENDKTYIDDAQPIDNVGRSCLRSVRRTIMEEFFAQFLGKGGDDFGVGGADIAYQSAQVFVRYGVGVGCADGVAYGALDIVGTDVVFLCDLGIDVFGQFAARIVEEEAHQDGVSDVAAAESAAAEAAFRHEGGEQSTCSRLGARGVFLGKVYLEEQFV